MSTEALDLLDSKMTDAEWERNRQRAKFLRDCKTKGFKRLASLGRFKGGIDLAKAKAVQDHTPIEFATEAARMVNEGMTITAACEKFGRNPGDLKYYCEKFGIKYRSIKAKRQWDYDATYIKIRRMVNEKGYRLKDAANRLDASPKVLKDILKSKGRTYNAKSIKIERAKK